MEATEKQVNYIKSLLEDYADYQPSNTEKIRFMMLKPFGLDRKTNKQELAQIVSMAVEWQQGGCPIDFENLSKDLASLVITLLKNGAFISVYALLHEQSITAKLGLQAPLGQVYYG